MCVVRAYSTHYNNNETYIAPDATSQQRIASSSYMYYIKFWENTRFIYYRIRSENELRSLLWTTVHTCKHILSDHDSRHIFESFNLFLRFLILLVESANTWVAFVLFRGKSLQQDYHDNTRTHTAVRVPALAIHFMWTKGTNVHIVNNDNLYYVVISSLYMKLRIPR